MTPPTEVLSTKDDLFFAALAKTGQITRAADIADIDRSHAYKRRDADPAFGERWAKALDTYNDALEAEAHRRAVEGIDELVIYQGTPSVVWQTDETGKLVVDENNKPLPVLGPDGRPKLLTVKKHSDALLALMLKAKRREYRDQSKLELTGADGGPVQVVETPLAAARKIAFALAMGLRAAAQQVEDGSDLG